MYAYTTKHTHGGRPLYVGTIHGQKITATSREEFQRLAWQAERRERQRLEIVSQLPGYLRRAP
jgi:hypothetical protein